MIIGADPGVDVLGGLGLLPCWVDLTKLSVLHTHALLAVSHILRYEAMCASTCQSTCQSTCNGPTT